MKQNIINLNKLINILMNSNKIKIKIIKFKNKYKN
jgi:hypothetical protein